MKGRGIGEEGEGGRGGTGGGKRKKGDREEGGAGTGGKRKVRTSPGDEVKRCLPSPLRHIIHFFRLSSAARVSQQLLRAPIHLPTYANPPPSSVWRHLVICTALDAVTQRHHSHCLRHDGWSPPPAASGGGGGSCSVALGMTAKPSRVSERG